MSVFTSVREMIRVKLATTRSKTLYEGFLARADQACQDTHQADRLHRPECKACFYILSPQAPATDSHCHVCKVALPFKDEFCSACARQRSLCRRCGADLEFRKRGT